MKKTTKAIMLTTFMLLVLTAIFIIPMGIAPHTNIGTNYKNVTVWTQVNITHSRPEVLNVTIYEAPYNITLKNITISAGSTKQIYCNATLRSWNGFNDITIVNSTLWHVPTSTSNSTDNNNSHYTNASCYWNTSNAPANNYTGWYVCVYDVLYYANNGTWGCNFTIEDSWNYTNYGNGSTIFLPVYALNLTDGIDYGGAAVYEYTGNKTANITNIGNMNINISVEGYGAVRGDGLAMKCSLNGNITVANERFATSDVNWTTKTPLVGTAGGVRIPGLTMPKQTNDSLVVNTTYWQVYINETFNPAGNCTGNIIFTALAP